jgi:hypothetical protein
VVKKIVLNSGDYALVDDQDFDRVSGYAWQLCSWKNNRYAVHSNTCNKKRIHIRMHRLIMDAKKGQAIDHINGNGLDNRRCNLRFATQGQNLSNISKYKQGATSQYKGVFWHKKANKWQASISFNNKSIYLGLFDKEIDAAKAYDTKAKELFGEYARINFG